MKSKKMSAIAALVLSGVIAAGTAPAKAFEAKADANKYFTDYATYQEEQKAAENLLAQIGEEGSVLLKNNGTLPFDTNIKNITMFGAASVEPCYGGGGSGTGSVSSYQTQITPQMALESAGFNVNPRLVNFYQNEYFPTHPKTASTNSEIKYNYQEPTREELKCVESSYKLYGDAAIIFKYGSGSEGTDKQRTEYDDGVKYSAEEQAIEGSTSPTATHTLEFTPREIDLIKYVSEHFDKVVLVLNTGNVLEMSWIQDFDGVDAVLWMGNPGTTGFSSLGKLLNGTVSPSGHLADIYPADFTQDPSWFNYADNSGTTGICAMYDEDGNKIEGILAGRDKENMGIPVVEYEEGIYYGYRWYETASATNRFAALAGDDVNLSDYLPDGVTDLYYNRYNGVVYPFGYGLSYTTFNWELVDTAATGTLTAGSDVTVKVKVTNTGSVAAKDVVQVYYSAPYTDGGIEKSSVNLVQFAKTKTLRPNESEILEITFAAKDMASFDYNDANKNGFKGYELEAGTYTISLQTDSHTKKESCTITRTVDATIKYDGSDNAHNYNAGYGDNAEAVFSQGDIYDSLGITAADGFDEIFTSVTRAGEGLKLPSAPTIATSTVSRETIDNIEKYNYWNPREETEDDPWYVATKDIPENWTQGAGVADADGHYAILAADMVGIDPEGTTPITSSNKQINGKTGKEAWDLFMNQLTLDELITAMGCKAGANDHIDMEKITAADGPAQLKGSPVGTFWCCETLIGTTWNVELAEKQGIMVGNEGLFQNCLGWWGPGANIHRSPFSGRNFEYYSQDGVHSGYMAAAVISGAQSKGLVCYMKHFAVNDQETFRESNDGVSTWLSEQAMREIYLKPFELAVKLGGVNGLMTSYNRIGAVSADVNYRLMETVCAGEWGFDGNFVSDANAVNTKWYTGSNVKSDVLTVRAGGCVNLNNASNLNAAWDATLRNGKGNVTFKGIQGQTGLENAVEDSSGYYAIRKVAQRFLHVNINTFALRNGVDTSAAFATTELANAYANVNYNASVGITSTDANASSVTYKVTAGTLPNGMTLSSSGTISGSATEKGSYTFTVTATLDYTITTTKQYTINVVSPFTVDNVTGKFDSLKLGEEYDGTISFVQASSLRNVTYSATGLPAGLSFETDGTLYGTPTEAGEYTVVVSCKGTSGRNTVTYTETYNITVAGDTAEEDSVYIGENGNWFINGKDTGVAAQGPQGEKGDKGDKGDKGETGEKGSGCNGSIGTNGAVMMTTLLFIAAISLFIVRKTQQNKGNKKENGKE